ncbi:germination protein YpeB [Geomicrobium sediminis]|uniref:Spore germination protein n=1 Tax=Geomicrobium sediminis TaxID=1347788 RepID=A0ABS2PDZ6_9BACL|nr:germination protein YpeB [Geomicrobium sediminis]MBM7633551.1 spore germination protein [Geomicrobium sediminis]
MFRAITIAVLSVALLGTGIFAYQTHQEKEALAISHENNYQRAFHQLSYHMDQLEDELGASLATNGASQFSGSLAEVWRISSLAHNEMGELPLGMIPAKETDQYLANVAEFSYETAVRDREEEPLTDEEYDKLENFYSQAKEIKHDLRTVQAQALNNDFRWSDVERELMSEQNPGEGTMVSSFKSIDQKAKGFSENNWNDDAGFSLDVNKRLAKVVKDKEELSEEEIIKKAKAFLDLPTTVDAKAEKLGEGMPYKGYQVVIEDSDGERNYMIDMTERGGLPVWALQSRDITEPKIGLNEASERAKEFLEDKGITDVQLVDSKQYDTIGTFQFVPVKDDVRLYPDALIVEIALDDGDLVGFKGANYFANHRERHDLSPVLTLDDALDELHPNLKSREEHLAVIENQNGDEVLTYEIFATMNGDTYRIYLNADTGLEEEVKRMQEAEPVYDVDVI